MRLIDADKLLDDYSVFGMANISREDVRDELYDLIDNQPTAFDIDKARAEVIEEINIILKNMYLEISNTVNGNDYTSKNDLVTIVASKCRQYISKELEQLKEQNE